MQKPSLSFLCLSLLINFLLFTEFFLLLCNWPRDHSGIIFKKANLLKKNLLFFLFVISEMTNALRYCTKERNKRYRVAILYTFDTLEFSHGRQLKTLQRLNHEMKQNQNKRIRKFYFKIY